MAEAVSILSFYVSRLYVLLAPLLFSDRTLLYEYISNCHSLNLEPSLSRRNSNLSHPPHSDPSAGRQLEALRRFGASTESSTIRYRVKWIEWSGHTNPFSIYILNLNSLLLEALCS